MQLADSFRIDAKAIVAFVGAGGKTSAMFRLADELCARGQRVITTMTTRLGVIQIATQQLLLRYEASPGFVARVRAALDQHSRVHIVGEQVEVGKVGGVPPSFIDELATQDWIDAVLYEADGARGLPFKAPAAHEPVIANRTTLVVPVVGVSAIGAPLDDAHVHRAEIAARLAGARIGETLAPIHIARVITHANGGLRNIPTGARLVVLVNQVETDAQLETARSLARLLLSHKEIEAVAIGAVQNVARPICETHRRAATIVLAMGAR